jgi:aspartyl/asparaginyl beta-hydroxylase (cupin superfamily)
MTALAARIADKLFRLTIRVSEALIRRGSPQGRQAWFDPREFAWTVVLEQRWSEVRRELDHVLLDRDAIPSFQDVSIEQRAITDDNRWKTYFMFVFGTPIEVNCQRCPLTVELLQAIPGLQNAMFSILAPGKDIPEHRGPYNGVLRYHLALKVPRDGDSCAIWVDGERRIWSEGETMIFDDSFPHRVRNDTREERVVLFADFERPLAWPLAVINRAVLAWLAATPFVKRGLDRLLTGRFGDGVPGD